MVPHLAALVLLPASFKLGYLYIQSSSSWVVESFSQFKLSVQHVNAQAALGTGNNFSFAVFNTQGDSSNALAGAIELLSDPDVIGLVGTGYSSAAEAAARYCTLMRKPMISPGSTSPDLVDKCMADGIEPVQPELRELGLTPATHPCCSSPRGVG
jgi:ABC-type branched-subunit amino acid transport system substrate-binding protein